MFYTCQLPADRVQYVSTNKYNALHNSFTLIYYKIIILSYIYTPGRQVTKYTTSCINFERNMSQQQQERPQQETAIKYDDVFDVSSELGSQHIAPKDASAMQSEENRVLGRTQKFGLASVMQSTTAVNVKRGVVGREEGTTVAKDRLVNVSEAEIAGRRIITEAVGGEVHVFESPKFEIKYTCMRVTNIICVQGRI